MSFIVFYSLVGFPIADISKATISENSSLPGGSCKEGIKWNRMHIESATGEKSVKNMETCAYNTGYHEWLCVRMTMKIMQ
jgi:hypothetical protein